MLLLRHTFCCQVGNGVCHKDICIRERKPFLDFFHHLFLLLGRNYASQLLCLLRRSAGTNIRQHLECNCRIAWQTFFLAYVCGDAKELAHLKVGHNLLILHQILYISTEKRHLLWYRFKAFILSSIKRVVMIKCDFGNDGRSKPLLRKMYSI